MKEEVKNMLIERLNTEKTSKLAWMITKGGFVGDEWKLIYDVYMSRPDRTPMKDIRRLHNKTRWAKRTKAIPDDINIDDISTLNVHQLRRLAGEKISKSFDSDIVEAAKVELKKRNSRMFSLLS